MQQLAYGSGFATATLRRQGAAPVYIIISLLCNYHIMDAR
jgi:hypothetical protein